MGDMTIGEPYGWHNTGLPITGVHGLLAVVAAKETGAEETHGPQTTWPVTYPGGITEKPSAATLPQAKRLEHAETAKVAPRIRIV